MQVEELVDCQKRNETPQVIANISEEVHQESDIRNFDNAPNTSVEYMNIESPIQVWKIHLIYFYL